MSRNKMKIENKFPFNFYDVIVIVAVAHDEFINYDLSFWKKFD